MWGYFPGDCAPDVRRGLSQCVANESILETGRADVFGEHHGLYLSLISA